MERLFDNCSQCDCGNKRLIVNRKYYLCDEKNYIRLNGKSKREANQFKNEKGRSILVSNDKISKLRSNASIESLKKRYSIKKISSAKRFRCSDGNIVSQTEIQRRYANTIDAIKLEREPVCQGTGRSDYPLSPSHTISQKRCKDLGKAELIWHPGNIEIEGYHEPSSNPIAAHNIWEVGTIEQKKSLLNWNRKIQFIKLHDPEQYRKLMLD